jgi:hypothetical protein
LNIQIANDAGLTHRCHMVERHLAALKKIGRTETALERVAYAQRHFGPPASVGSKTNKESDAPA